MTEIILIKIENNFSKFAETTKHY